MQELLDAAVTGVNIVPTVLLTFVMIYWLIVLLGMIDMDAFDIDLDLDSDLDVDADAEVGTGGGGGAGLSTVLAFFNIGHMPLMIFVSFVAFSMWVIMMFKTVLLGHGFFLIDLVILLGVFIASLFIAKFLTTPIAKFFIKLKKEDEAIDPIGKQCKVILTVRSDSKGQAEVYVGGTSILITAVTREGVELKKGDTALVIDYQKDKKQYLIEPY